MPAVVTPAAHDLPNATRTTAEWPYVFHPPWCGRLLTATTLWLVAAAAWWALAQQHQLMWARLPATTVERFVADGVNTPLPNRVPLTTLSALCTDNSTPQRWAWWPSQKRGALASCVAQVLHPTSGSDALHLLLPAPALQKALNQAQNHLQSQAHAAQRWLLAYEQQSPALRQTLQSELTSLQTLAIEQAPALAPPWPAPPRDARQPVGRDGMDDQAAVGAMRNNLVRLQANLAVPQPTPDELAHNPQAQQAAARTLLLATGFGLNVDVTHSPPKATLVSDRTSLADTLEWQRRAQGYAQRGFGLTRLHATAQALMLGAALVLIIATLTGQAPLAWLLAGVGMGLGHLLLLDVSLTGPAALRYLAERQFVALPVGESAVHNLVLWPGVRALSAPVLAHLQPLVHTLGLPGVAMPPWIDSHFAIWLPWLAVAPGLLLLRWVRDGQCWIWAPLRAWVDLGDQPWPRALQLLLLLGMGALALVGLGMAAAVSEGLVLLACVGVATYWARQAAYANVADGFAGYSAWAVALGLLLATGLSLARGDLGHALMALVVALVCILLFGGRWLRTAAWLAFALAVVLLGRSVWLGQIQTELAWLVNLLPTHGRERFAALLDPFNAASSDLARVHWLMDSAGTAGWGLGYVPWQGLAPAGAMDGLPLQGPSDYVLAALVGIWGVPQAVAWLALVGLALVWAAWQGVRTSTWPGQATAVRWLAALGTLGVVVMLAKLLVSVGGVAGWLPLTGLPVALLGYGPVTHAATLLYLLCATGLAHVKPALGPTRGINIHPQQFTTGRLTRRATGLVGAFAATAAALLTLTALMLTLHRPHPAEHLALQRLEAARLVAAHLRPAVAEPTSAQTTGHARTAPDRQTPQAVDQSVCPELTAATQALQTALVQSTRHRTRMLDTVGMYQVGMRSRSCETLAHDLARVARSDLAKVAVADGANSTQNANSAPTVARRDFATPNAYWGLPGCVGFAQSTCQPESTTPWQEAVGDPWLQDALAARLPAITRTPSGHTERNHRSVPRGADATLTLDPAMQALANRLARCYTGQLRGPDCEDLLPRDANWRKRFFEGLGIRAGVLGITVLDVDSGQVLAMAGALSDCARHALHTPLQTQPDGRTPVLRDGEPCAQVPDRRHAYLETHNPAQWLVPPGSSLKPWVFAAGADSGLIAPTEQAHWLRVLAESHDQQTVERMALVAQQRWLQLLAQAGLGDESIGLLPGLAAPWRVQSFDGYDTLKPSRMDPLTAERIRADIRSGINADKKYGHATMTDYLAAQALVAASIGGGDLRINTLGLAQAWMRLDRATRGEAGAAPSPVLLVTQATDHQSMANAPETKAPPANGGKSLSARAAQRALQATSGATASRHSGTAQGSCRLVFGACPPDGVAGLSGKTGTADVLDAEHSPYLKPGQSMPSRLFGGVFSAQGRRLAVAVMSTRVREDGKNTIEHAPSAAAEAALTFARQLGVQP